MSPSSPKNALLLVGGGARAAYQAGVLRSLAKAFPQVKFPILTGVSAGAINAASLANDTDEFSGAVERLVRCWESITVDQVFSTDSRAPGLDILKWVIRMATARQLPPFKGMLNTAPLRRFLCRSLGTDGALHGVEANIRSGRLSALGITTAHYPTGRTTTWVQGKDVEPWHRASRCGKSAKLTVDHIMASSALPLVFPSINLEDGWHGDGGLRLTSPLSSTVHLGADRVLAISTLVGPSPVALDDASRDYPPLASVINVLLESVFLDRLDTNAAKMRQINQLIADHPRSPEFGLRPMEVLVVRPSVDLGVIAQEFVAELPRVLRHIFRGLGTDQSNHSAIVATLLFQPHYIQRIIEIGEKDGDRRRDEFAAFFGFAPNKAVAGPESVAPFQLNGTNGHSDPAYLRAGSQAASF